MSTSRAIKPKRDDTLLSNWEHVPERAPSIERPDAPTVARFLAMIGLFLFILGGLAVTSPLWRSGAPIIGFGWGFFAGSIGLCFLLYHAFAEHDVQFRKLYAFAGLALVLVGVALRIYALKAHMDWYILGGLPALFFGLVILIGVIRNETDASFRTLLLNIIGALGGLMIVFSIAWGLRSSDFLAGEGAIMMALGLFYASAYIGLQDNREQGYYAGLVLGALGLIGFFAGLIRSAVPESNFLVPGGLVMMSFSLVYFIIALGVCVDWPVVVLARRELAAYFYSPLAYLVLIGQLILTWFMFGYFVGNIAEASDRGGGLLEPIIGNYIFALVPVIVQLFFVPALTMRLVSEEKRSGTLEVMMTAPVNEVSVVLGKFFAGWVFFMMLWVPCGLFLISLRFIGGEEFDYRPMLCFLLSMGAISAGLISIGVFMSSLTSNQIIAAVFTFIAVMVNLLCYIVKFDSFAAPFVEILTFVNYLDFMLDSVQGIIAPKYFVFHLSVAVVFLFATVKVLESRKWA